MNCILRSGVLFATLSLAIAKHKQSSSAKGCYPRGTLSQAVDTLYVKAAWLKATIPVSTRHSASNDGLKDMCTSG